MKKLNAIFGGNFDPIHYGHINSAKKIAKKICIQKIILLPNKNPPHRKKTTTSIIDRIKMIKIAINKDSLFKISYLESKGKNIFYTIETLQKIRKRIGNLQSLCFIIGEDNLQYFHLWKNWKKILLFSHLLIHPRQCIKKNHFKLKEWIISHSVDDYNLLHLYPFGLIFFSNIPMINISSSEIRSNYYKGKNSYKLLPLNVQKYISLNKIYQKK